MTYNGSANWETHNIAEKLDNDLYHAMQSDIGDMDVDDIDTAFAKQLITKTYWDSFDPDVDVDRDDLRLVVWDEIADHLIAEWEAMHEGE